MHVNGVDILGRSVSGYATAVFLPAYNLCFDMGEASSDALRAEYVAITHGHMDHLGCVAQHAHIREMVGQHPPTYIVPPCLSDAVPEIFEIWGRVQGHGEAPYRLAVTEPGSRADLPRNAFLKPFRTFHRVESQGYTVYETRDKIKAEYLGLPGRQLGQLKAEGVEITDQINCPVFTFTGDTTSEVFEDRVFDAKVVMIECTFLEGISEEEATYKGHIHINQLAENEAAFEEAGAVVLCHFSKRYNNRDVEEAIKGLPSSLRDKTTFLPV